MLLFLVDLINIKKLRILFCFFYSLSYFNFIILRNRATSDSYLFFRANTHECLHLKNYLLQYEKASGHKIYKDENI